MKDFKDKVPFFKFFRHSFGSKNIFARSGEIDSILVGQKLLVYNGNSFRSILPKIEIVGTPVGHYVFSTISGSSIHKRKRKKKEKKKRGKKLFIEYIIW